MLYFAHPGANDLWRRPDKIDHTGQIDTADPSVNDKIHFRSDRFLDLKWIDKRTVIPGQFHRRTQQGLAQFIQQSRKYRMGRHSNADGSASRVLQPLRNLLCRRQDECVWPRRH